jgi:serine/threonine protein kinase
MADWTGKTLGRVQINDLVARGGMAEVYTGIHETHGLVAVKVLRGLLERDEHQLTRFKREAEVIGELHHPNIVRMLDFTIVDETPCLIMDFIPGPSLAVYLKQLYGRDQRLPIAIIVQILRSVASALDYAHNQNIIHRDIKPANILLRSRTQDIDPELPLPLDVDPILTDFGLVRLLDSTLHTTTGSVSGTPTYMSPEQARGEKLDKRTDIYSLGIVLYEMLAGQIPFQADTTFGMLMKHINEPPPPIRGISSDLQALIDRALAKDPDLRYQSAGEMADEFLSIFNGQTVSPGTFHNAEMARKAAEERRPPKSGSQPPIRFRWLRVVIETTVALLIAFVIFQIVGPVTQAVTATPVPRDPNVAAGKLRFGDFSNVMDEIRLTLNSAEPPGDGYHYDAWLISDDNATTRKLGNVTFNTAGVGQLSLIDPDQENILAGFNQIVISKEPDETDSNEPTGEIAYSSIFPPNTLIPIRKLLVLNETTPESLALIQGLWYYSGSYIEISINGYDVAGDETIGLRKAFEAGDEVTVRKRTEEIINQIVGASSDLYLDHDEDGTVNDTTDGFGSFPNGDSPGYLQETISQVNQAIEATDSTPNIRSGGENVQICIQNMDGRLQHILDLALQLNDTSFGPGMEPIITELETLGDVLVRGADSDGDGLIEPLPDECGADSAYEFAYTMADMPLLPGENRIPLSGK